MVFCKQIGKSLYLWGQNRTFQINEWIKGENYIEGVQINDVIKEKFRYATKSIKWLVLNNYNSKPGVTTYYKNIIIKEE